MITREMIVPIKFIRDNETNCQYGFIFIKPPAKMWALSANVKINIDAVLSDLSNAVYVLNVLYIDKDRKWVALLGVATDVLHIRSTLEHLLEVVSKSHPQELTDPEEPSVNEVLPYLRSEMCI